MFTFQITLSQLIILFHDFAYTPLTKSQSDNKGLLYGSGHNKLYIGTHLLVNGIRLTLLFICH